MIHLDSVSKVYGSKLAVDQLTLQVQAGEVFAFLGPNGAGKTTSIKLITGLLRPTKGYVWVAGHSMAGNSVEARRQVSFVPDQPHLYEKLTARDFLEFTRKIYGIDGPESRAYQEELIDTFEIGDFADDLIESYSHGMRQRVVFASALLHRPRVLVLDEPMVGLDPKSMRIAKDQMKATALRGSAVFMSTHTLSIAEEIADRIAIIRRGKLVKCGTLEELQRDRPGGMTLEDYFLQVTAEDEI
ncbi:ABC transporter ATP-binding protein [bacterium]|nr:ABC transporter ATP-binding protein [bacterium]